MYIGAAARLSGTTIKTIRHYETLGLLPEAPREGKYRVYDQQSVELLVFIKCAQQLGFKLKELQVLFQAHRGEPFPWEVALQAVAAKKQQLLAQIDNLHTLTAGLDAFAASLHQAQADCPLKYGV